MALSLRWALLASLLVIAAFASTPQWWSQTIMKYQNDLQRTLPLNEVKWVYSRHAHDYYQGYFWVPPIYADIYKRPLDTEIHHSANISTQLESGVRWLSFNMHYVPEIASSTSNPEDAVYNCVTNSQVYYRCFVNGTALERARCQANGIQNFGFDSGCYPLYDRSFTRNLQEVTDWLNAPANSEDVAIIDLKWKLDPIEDNEAAAMSIVSTVINRLAGSIVYTPAAKGAGRWPTINEMIAANRRIVFVCDSPACATSAFIFTPRLSTTPNSTEDRQQVAGFNQNACGSNNYGPSSLPNDDFIKFWEDKAYRILVNGLPPWGNNPPSGTWPPSMIETRYAMYCGFSIGLSDATFYNTEQAIWSFAYLHPQRSITSPRTGTCASVLYGNYLWVSEDCTTNLPYACQNIADPKTWTVLLTNGPGDATPACPTNYTYGYPRNSWEMNGLFNAIAGTSGLSSNVWLNVPAITANINVAPPLLDFNNTFKINGVSSSPYLNYPGIPLMRPLNISDVTGPEGPRFCGLKPDILDFDCRWDVYAQQIADREVGYLVFAGIGLAVSCIFGVIIILCCCDCIFRKGGRLNKLARMESDGDIDNGKGRKRDRFRYFLILPFVIVIVGSVPLFIGNIRLTAIWNDAATFTRDQRDSLLILKVSIVETLLAFPNINGTEFDTVRLRATVETGISNMEKDFNDFIAILNGSSTLRTVVTWFITIGMLVFCLFGFIFLIKKAPKWLLFLLILINFVVFITIMTFLVHSSIKVAADDVCNEITRPNGMFALWQRGALNGFAQMRSAAKSALDLLTIDACNAYRQLCSLPYQVCLNYPCHQGNLFSEIGNVTIIDSDATIRTFLDCASNCADSTLRQGGSIYLDGRQIFNQYSELETDIFTFLENLSGKTGQDKLTPIFCGIIDDYLSYVYGGAAVLLIGELVEMALLFWLGY